MGLISNGGTFGWLLLILIITAAVFAVISAVRLWGKKEPPKHAAENSVMNLLWTGILSEAVGVLGTVTGIYNAASAISSAGDVSPKIVWRGIHVALSTTLLGLGIFVICTILWMIFRSKFNKIYGTK